MPRRSFTIPAAALAGALLLVLTASPAASGSDQPPKPSDPNVRDPNAPVRVYTNKDLAKYRSARRPAVVVATTGRTEEEPAAEDQAALYPDEKERRLAEIEEKIGAARARIAEIDLRLRSLANPFLPRPQVSEEDREVEAGMDAKERYARLASEKAGLEREIEALKAGQDALLIAPTRPRSKAAPTNPEAQVQPQP